jgi:hypothetical protein
MFDIFNAYRQVFYFLILLSSFFLGCYLNGNRVSSKYELEIASAKAIGLENIRLAERNFAKKISESDANYAKEKSRIARRAGSIDFSGLRVTPRNCVAKTAPGAARTSDGAPGVGDRAGGVDFGDVAEKITGLGRDYDDSIAQIRELSILLQSCGG